MNISPAWLEWALKELRDSITKSREGELSASEERYVEGFQAGIAHAVAILTDAADSTSDGGRP